MRCGCDVCQPRSPLLQQMIKNLPTALKQEIVCVAQCRLVSDSWNSSLLSFIVVFCFRVQKYNNNVFISLHGCYDYVKSEITALSCETSRAIHPCICPDCQHIRWLPDGRRAVSGQDTYPRNWQFPTPTHPTPLSILWRLSSFVGESSSGMSSM